MHIDPTAVLGPDSLAWRYAGDNLQLLVAGTTLTLQVAHPVVGAGVGEHSVYKTDPWGRLERTTKFGIRLLYGGPAEAVRASRELMELHAKIKGVDEQGRRYFALDREAYAWVHLTSYHAFTLSQELFGAPLDEAQKAQLYREWRQQGRLLGIREADMPADVGAFWQYFDAMIRDRLEDNRVVRDLLAPSENVPKPPKLRRLPTAAWEAMYKPADWWAKLNTRNTLPAAFRKKLGIKVSAADRVAFEAMRAPVQATHKLIPPRMRYIPAAYRALRRAGVIRDVLPMRPAHAAR